MEDEDYGNRILNWELLIGIEKISIGVFASYELVISDLSVVLQPGYIILEKIIREPRPNFTSEWV